MNKIDKLTQKIFSKFNDDSLFYCNIYLTGTEENSAVVLFDMEGYVLKVNLYGVKTEYTMPEDSYVLVSEMCIDENENVIHFSVWSEERGEEDFELKFDRANAEMMPCRKTYNVDCVWSVIVCMAADIYGRYSFDETFISEAERNYLPLVLELMEIADSSKAKPELPVLTAYAEKYGLNEFTAIILKNVRRAKTGISNKRFSGLDDVKYEPLWRELYMVFGGLCKDYPTISEIIGLEPENIHIRKNITDTLYKAGYEGVYPDFRKTGELKGVHLTQSHDKAYLVGCENNVLYMVHCDEMCSDGEPVIIFRSGTIVMKDGFDYSNADIYSSMFRNGGYHIEKSFSCCAENEDISQAAEIAVKRAELKKLTRKECKAADVDKNFLSFLPVGMLTGLLFGVLWTLGMMIFAFLLEVLFGYGVGEALQLMTDTIWLNAAGTTGLAFGFAMTVIMYMARRK